MIAPLRSRLVLALGVSAALLVAGCYSKIPEEDGGTMPSAEAKPLAEAKRPTMTPLEREQAAALADQKKRVAALAETPPSAGGEEKKAATVEEKKVASVEAKPEPRKGPATDHEQATTASAVAPGAGGFWVQIGSAREEKDGEALWNKSKAAHPTILGDASHAVVRADLGPGKGVFYRVHVGPYENAAAAGTMCGRLRAAHVDCFLIAPGGAIITPSETSRASVEPAKPATGAGKTTTATAPAAKPAPTETKPTATAAPAKASAETEPKKPDSKTDVPFRTMGLPGLPD